MLSYLGPAQQEVSFIYWIRDARLNRVCRTVNHVPDMSGMVLEVQKLMPQPHHRQHSRFLQSLSMAMELGHVAGEL
jgi:hypothetical protein